MVGIESSGTSGKSHYHWQSAFKWAYQVTPHNYHTTTTTYLWCLPVYLHPYPSVPFSLSLSLCPSLFFTSELLQLLITMNLATYITSNYISIIIIIIILIITICSLSSFLLSLTHRYLTLLLTVPTQYLQLFLPLFPYNFLHRLVLSLLLLWHFICCTDGYY